MNGILIVNKPKGYTSRDIVNIISKKLNTKKVGHTGTLDPIAEGVLVVPIGRALKISELLTSEKKEYIAKVILGYETDMLDFYIYRDGDIKAASGVNRTYWSNKLADGYIYEK